MGIHRHALSYNLKRLNQVMIDQILLIWQVDQ